MPGWFGFQRAGIALVAMSAFACTSSSEFEALHDQLNEIHVEILQLQKQGATKTEVTEVGDAIQGRVEELARAEEDFGRELKRLTDRIAALETKLDDTNFRLAQLAQQITATQQELQVIRNAAETARRRTMPPPQSAPPSPTDPQALYDTAYNDYVRGNYDLAILSFREYLENYGATDLADNAAYWIGECYFRQTQYAKAIEQFDEVLIRYQGSDRHPSALLRKGYAYFELGRRSDGVVQLQKVICEHTGTDEAHLADQRLQEMGIDVDCPDA